MKKLLLSIYFTFFICSSLSALPMVDITFGYLFFGNAKARRVYNTGGENITISGSYPVYDIWHVFGSAGYWERSGRTLHYHHKLRLEAIPISIGIKPVMTLGCNVDCYFTLGPRYFFLKEHMRCPEGARNVNKSTVGAFVGTGFLFIPCDGCTFDIFAEYSYFGSKIPCGGCIHHEYINNFNCISANIGIGYTF
jgi:hypothetical protein